MILRIAERLRLRMILPEQGDILTMRLVQDLDRRLVPDAAEQEALGFAEDKERRKITWEKDSETDIDFRDAELAVIRDALNARNKSKELTLEDVRLWGLFHDGNSEPSDAEAASDRAAGPGSGG